MKSGSWLLLFSKPLIRLMFSEPQTLLILLVFIWSVPYTSAFYQPFYLQSGLGSTLHAFSSEVRFVAFAGV